MQRAKKLNRVIKRDHIADGYTYMLDQLYFSRIKMDILGKINISLRSNFQLITILISTSTEKKQMPKD